MRRALVVSLHDVSPHTWEPCKRILAALDVPVSLLVIPDHHGRGHFTRDAAFCEWLRNRAAAGDEAVIHGYFHRRETRDRETLAARLITRIYTAGEGEFFDIDYSAARDRVAKARDEFRSVGLEPSGFIAPAWLLSDEGQRAIRELGIAYTTRLRTVTEFQRGREWQSQSLCWSVRAAWRRAMSLAWNASLFRRLKNVKLMRIAIHPVDIEHPQIWKQITRLVSAAGSERDAMTYRDWVAADYFRP